MKHCILIPILLSFGFAAQAEEERVVINNFYPLNQENFDLGDHIFHLSDNEGGFEVVEGPFEDGPARCVGSGFGFKDGTNTITGICIFGEGTDTFTISWKAGEQGAPNSWEVVTGQGRYADMSGSGLATTDVVTSFQALPLRLTRIVGTVDLDGG